MRPRLKMRLQILAAAMVVTAGTLVTVGVLDNTAPAVPPPIVVIVMENHEYDSIVGSSSAPYLNDTFLKNGRLFSNYHALSHPSLPNYLAMTSGQLLCNGSDSCARPFTKAQSIFKQFLSAGVGWQAYEESMPSNCALNNSGQYVVRHNPPPYYSSLVKACKNKDVPYPTPLPIHLKPFTFVTPNVCNDMHDCSVSTGDTWLKNHVPSFLGKGAIVLVVFDEGTTSEGGGGHVFAGEIGAGIPSGVTDATAYTHYNLLAGLEDYFGVSRLANASGVVPLPFTGSVPTSPPPTSVTPPPTAYGPQPTITCPTGSANIPAGSSIQSAVNANPAGTTFCLAAGIFAVSSPITPQTGDRFIGAYGATLDGSAMTSTDVNDGIFRAHNQDIDNVTIQNLVIRNSPVCGIHAFTDSSDGWLIDHNEITGNRIGISHGNTFEISNNWIHDNYQYGIGGFRSHGSVIEGNDLSFNASQVLQFPGDSANSKWTETQNTTVRNNYVHDNYWSGIWFDGENTGDLIEGNTVMNNAGNGIFEEVSGQAIVRNNIVTGSSERNIYLSESHDVEVYGNTLSGSPRGIALFQDGSRIFESELGNNSIHDNTITVPAGALAVSLTCSNLTSAECAVYSTSRGIAFDGNHYDVPDVAGPWWYWNQASRTWTGWQGQGQDPNGTVT